MPTNSQIERRLKREYQKHFDFDEDIEDVIELSVSYHVPFLPEFCYLPEIREGERYLFIDERKWFCPTTYYLNFKHACENAIASLLDDNDVINLNGKSIEVFFEKYYPLYIDLIELWNYRAFHSFRYLFHCIIEWRNFFFLGFKAQAALQNFNPYNEDDIEDWLIDYNRLRYTHGLLWESFSFKLVDENSYIYKQNIESFTIYLQGKEISDCIVFINTYEEWQDRFGNKQYS